MAVNESTIFSVDLFADWHPPLTPSTPKPGRSFSEELEQYPDDEFYNSLREGTAQLRAEAQKKAEALGFSSWKEKERHDEEEARKWREEYVKEHGHSPSPPILTEEEQIAQDLQYQRSFKPEPEPCDCEEHFHPGFCPQQLLSYKSQGSDPSDFAFLQSLHPTDLNVRIHETDSSKRIPDWWLEHLWGIPSQGRVLCLPPWAKRDDIIQRMIDKNDVDKTMYHGQYDQNRRHSPPLTAISLTPDWGAKEVAKASPEFERQSERDRQREQNETYAGFDPKQTPPSNTTEVKNFHASFPAASTTDMPGTQSHVAAGAPTQPTRHERNRKSTAQVGPSGDTTKRASRAQTSGIKKRPAARKTATMRVAPSGSIQTRAQGVLKFLALDSSGRAISISGH